MGRLIKRITTTTEYLEPDDELELEDGEELDEVDEDEAEDAKRSSRRRK